VKLRVAAIAGVAALALAGSGCAGGDGGGGPKTLTVYVSAPLQGPRAAEGAAILDGAKLALADARARVGDLMLRAIYMDDTEGGSWSLARTAANARRASEDSSAIGYIGDLDSGATRVSLPITNQAQIVQISPGSTAVDLTRLPPVGNADPDQYRPRGDQTFARVVPDDDVQARAAALWAKQQGARTFAAGGERSAFGEISADAFASEAHALGIRPYRGESGTQGLLDPRSGADAVYYGVTSIPRPNLSAKTLSATDSTMFGPPALADPALLRAAPGIQDQLRIVSPFLDPSLLPQRGKRFVRAFQARYRRRPDAAAAYGYEAMALLLDAIRRAGDNGDARGAVTDQVLSTHDRNSVLGTYSIDGNGDTTLDAVTGYRISDGLPVFPVKLEAPG
jgi:branched-chain amino acid transport system substrate-binding protein